MSDKINIVILAAGKGTRLKINTPKPLCRALGKPLVFHVISELEKAETALGREFHYGVVIGHEKEKVQKCVQENFHSSQLFFANQIEQNGTGHAVKCYFEQNSEALNNKYTIITCADTPLIEAFVYESLIKNIEEKNCDALCATFELDNPTGYGRIITGSPGFNIVEEKDASLEQKNIKMVNSGLYIFKTSHIEEHISKLNNENNSGEFYLTDLLKTQFNVQPLIFHSSNQFLGVNNLIQLSQAENILRQRKLEELMLAGVQIQNPASVYIESCVQIAAETVIQPNVYITGETKIGSFSIIEAGTVLKNVIVGDHTIVKANCYLESAVVGSHVQLGPMARLREGSQIADECKIGNFVETKKVELHKGVKVSHLSYLGDAEVGENTNVGCGFVTCNYDGANKHKTTIGSESFIGSDCQVVAPIKIGDRAYIGSGSTINKDVPDDSFAIARERQITKEGMAKRFLKKKGQ